MANNLSPSYMKIRYRANGHDHTATYQVKFDGAPTPGTEPNMLTTDGSSVGFEVGVNGLCNALKSAFKTTDSFVLAEVWDWSDVELPPTFIYAFSIGIAGTAVSSNVPAGQAVFSFRTRAPGGLKIYLMESTYPLDLVIRPPFDVPSVENDIATYFLSDDSIIFAKSNNRPLATTGVITKTNDVLYRKYVLGI